jgi:hypothetical protein
MNAIGYAMIVYETAKKPIEPEPNTSAGTAMNV